MIRAEIQRAEGGRYATSLLLVPALWARAAVWRRFASFLGHRGWESHLLETCGLAGGLTTRAAAVAEYAAALPSPPVLVGHDAGAIVALLAASRARVAAVVLIAPLVPGSRGARTLAITPGSLVRLLLRWPVPPPRARIADLTRGELPAAAAAAVLGALADEDPGAVWDAARGLPLAAPGVPALVVTGERDPLLPAVAAAALAADVGAERCTLAGAGHWPVAGPTWQQAVDVAHRWIVQRLGEPLLELYAEALADRDEGSD